MTKPTRYYRPETIDDALRYTAETGGIALAGGALTFGQLLLPYDTLIDLQNVSEMRGIYTTEEGLTIGGTVTLQEVVESPLVMPALKHALTRTLPLNIRNGASVGESLTMVNPPGEWLAALVALDARIRQVGPERDDLRLRPLENFIRYGHQPTYRSILTHLYLPVLPKRTALGTAFVARTPADTPIVHAAAWVALDSARNVGKAVTVIGGASALPALKIELTTLAGNPLDEANIASAVKAVAPAVDPVADYRGSVEYRREMARTMTERALLDCMAQLAL
jgi:aerobic carbon-monoxide dehydrogenase medium subunit